MMTIERAPIGWRFWVRWVWLTVVGYSVGLLLGFVLGHFLLGNVMIWVVVGAGVGFMQWRTLRRFVQRSGWWVLANMAGLTVSFGLYAIVNHVWQEVPFDCGWPLGVLGHALALVLGGTFVGLLQQRILRRHVRRSVWWVLANALGWGLSAFGFAIQPDMSGHYPGVLVVVLFIRNGMLAPAVAGIILGTLTGGALIWLLRQPTPRKVS